MCSTFLLGEACIFVHYSAKMAPEEPVENVGVKTNIFLKSIYPTIVINSAPTMMFESSDCDCHHL